MRYLYVLLFLTIFNTLAYGRNRRSHTRLIRGQHTHTDIDRKWQNRANLYHERNTEERDEDHFNGKASDYEIEGRGNGPNTGSTSQGGGQGRGKQDVGQPDTDLDNGESPNQDGGKKEKTDEDFLYTKSGKRNMPHREDVTLVREDDVYVGGRHFKRYQEEVDGVPVMNSRQVTLVRGRSSVTGEEQETSIANKARKFRPGNARKLAHARELPLDRLRAACIAKSGGNSTRQTQFLDGKKQLYQSPKGDEHLVRILQFESKQGKYRGACLIDSVSGRVLKNWDPRESYRTNGDGGNIKTGKWRYGSSTKYDGLPTKQVGSKCQYQTDRVKLFHAKSSPPITPFNDSDIYSVNCVSESQDAANGGFSPANDAFFAATKYAEMMRSWLQTYDWMPGNRTATLVVHAQNVYLSDTIAYWDSTNGTLAFGDGLVNYYPLTSQDIVFHEMAHAFTSRYSDLIYAGESGCINEAYSDITGITGTSFISGQPVLEWSIGGDTKKSGGALRYFDDPTRDGKSITHIRNYNDEMNVHYCSGIYNYAFYNLVKREGMPIERAWKLFATTNMLLWTEETTMREGACDIIAVAAQLEYSYGDMQRLAAAFSSSGLNIWLCKGTEGGEGVIRLKNGMAVYGVAATEFDFRDCQGGACANGVPYRMDTQFRHFTITLPAVTTSHTYDLTITTRGRNGDADLYVQKNRQASHTDYLQRSSNWNSNEEIFISTASAGVYHIAVFAFVTFSYAKSTPEIVHLNSYTSLHGSAPTLQSAPCPNFQ